MPFELTVNTLHQVVVRRGVTASVPEEFTASAAQPGIFTTNNRGTGQGAVLGPSQSAVADPANPALRGQPVVIYCTGLGAVNATVALGAAAPSDPLANVRGEVSVLVGGKEARVLFAGLSPGYAGLYQVNAVLAADTPTGDEISLVITAGGQQSNTVTVAVR